MTLQGVPAAVKRGQDQYLDVSLAASNLPLRVVIHYQAPAGFAAIRQWLTLENTGSKTLTLRNLTVALSATVSRTGPRQNCLWPLRRRAARNFFYRSRQRRGTDG